MSASSYYADKLSTLADLFGADVRLDGARLFVGATAYPIVDDVIVLLDPAHWPISLRLEKSGISPDPGQGARAWELVQYSFGAEWTEYSRILPEHRDEFEALFDLVDLGSLNGQRVCDLGCGIGRWAHFLAPHCRELVLIDFSDAIFAARRNLRDVRHALFFLGDVTALPFRRNFADFGYCIGVLHHLTISALDAVQTQAAYARRLLVYLYYALDNRPWHYRILLRLIDAIRRRLCSIRDVQVRCAIARLIAVVIYRPLIGLGHVLDLFGRGHLVPLFETYRGKSLGRIEQDAYDRFFTSIEQRVSQRQIIETLSPLFTRVILSERPPYWHFLCERISDQRR